MPKQTWAEVYAEVPAAPFTPESKDEQALTDAFERFVGGPNRGFHLMRIYRTATQAASGNRFRLHGEKKSIEERFFEMAQREGFSEEECKAYLSVR